MPALRRAGVKIGISTHSHEELERALALAPGLCGARAGLSDDSQEDALGAAGGWSASRSGSGEWGEIPLVAIGGLTVERLPGVFAAGADVAAVVNDIVSNRDPEARAREWLVTAG